MFRKNVLLPSSESKGTPGKQTASTRQYWFGKIMYRSNMQLPKIHTAVRHGHGVTKEVDAKCARKLFMIML